MTQKENTFGKHVRAAALAAMSALPATAPASVTTYTEKPAVEPIVVGSGDTAMTQGYKLFRDDLWACWRFDDADNLLKDSSGHGHDLVAAENSVFEPLSSASDKVRGDSAAGFARKQGYLSLGTVPDCLKGGSPFTISMWVRETDQIQVSNGNAVGGYLYVGNAGAGHSDDLVTNSIALQKQSATQFYCGIPGKSAYRASLNLNGGTEMPEGNQGRWVHAAVVYTPGSGAKYYVADRTMTINSYTTLNPAFVDSVWFGRSRNGTSSRWLCHTDGTAETAIDEIFVFTNALTDAEIAFVREHSQPTEFSAKWQVEKGGTLCVAGVEPQEANGYGEVIAPDGLTLAPAGESYFGGTLSSGHLAIAPETVVTQTFAGTASYGGKTTVSSGVLVVRPEPAVPASLSANLVGFWTFDNPLTAGRDLSGNGNDMNVNANLGLVAAETPGGGKALDFAQSGDASRWLAKTATEPFSADGAAPPYSTGWPLTIAVWARTRSPFNAANAGLAAFEGRCAFGLQFPNADSAQRVSFGGRNGVGTTNWDAADAAAVTGAVHCYVLTFDPTTGATDSPATGSVAFYFDGEQKRTSTFAYKESSGNAQWAGAGTFQLGAGYSSGASKIYYNGLVEQAMLFDRPLSASEVAALAAFGAHPAPATATGALPATTVLDIASGAKAVFENANETVAGLEGAGALEISPSAVLAVTDSFSATGTAAGGGRLVLGPALAFASPGEGPGVREFLTATAGMVEMPASTANWTISGVGISNPSVSFRLRDNGDGTETLTCRIATAATVLCVR